MSDDNPTGMGDNTPDDSTVDQGISKNTVLKGIGRGDATLKSREGAHPNPAADSWGSKPSRRQALKTLAGSVGGVGVMNILSELGVAADSVKIPHIIYDGNVMEWKRVPRGWLQHVKSVRRARKKLHEANRDKKWAVATGQRASRETFGGKPGHKLIVTATDTRPARSAVPNEVNGIPVEVEVARDWHVDGHLSSTCDNYEYKQSCVEGGSYVNNGCCFSATCLVEYQANYYLMTSAHTFDGTNCGDTTCNDLAGLSLYSGPSNDDYYIGDVFIYSWDYDYVLVPADGSNVNGISNQIISEGIERVQGHVSEASINDLISSDGTVHHTGISTGRTDGTVYQIDQTYSTGNCTSDRDFIWTTTNAGSGDSGGPHFDTYIDGDELGIIGNHYSHDDQNGNHTYSQSPAAYEINNNHSIVFGSNTSPC